MKLDPDLMSREERATVHRWLVVNGVRHYVPLKPIYVHGRWIFYPATWRVDAPVETMRHWVRAHGGRDGWDAHDTRRVRLRIPIAGFLDLGTVEVKG